MEEEGSKKIFKIDLRNDRQPLGMGFQVPKGGDTWARHLGLIPRLPVTSGESQNHTVKRAAAGP